MQLSLCLYCKHRLEGPSMRCLAYPDGVPRRFRLGDDLHIRPTEGDHGVQYEMADGLTESQKGYVEDWLARNRDPAPADEQATTADRR